MGCGASLPPQDPCVVCLGAKQKPLAALRYCINCQLRLCSPCSDQHQAQFQRPHQVVSLSDYNDNKYAHLEAQLRTHGCRQHVTEMRETYCMRHAEVTCRDCNKQSHTGCDVRTIKDLREQWNGEIERKLRRMKLEKTTMEQKQAQLSNCLQQVPLQRQHLKDELHEQANRQQELLAQVKDTREQQIDERMDEKAEQLQELMTTAKARCGELHSSYGLHRSTLQRARDSQIANELQVLQEMRNSLRHTPVVTSEEKEELERALAAVTLSPPMLDEEGLEMALGEVEVLKAKATDVLLVKGYPSTPSIADSRRASLTGLSEMRGTSVAGSRVSRRTNTAAESQGRRKLSIVIQDLDEDQ